MARERKPRKKAQDGVAVDWSLIETVLTIDGVRVVYLYGPPGIGKTYSAFTMGRVNDEVYAITLTEDTPAAELRGHFVPEGGRLVWHDGPFTKAMREGARLVVNELTHANPEVHSLLHPVLESTETARLTLPNNETVVPAEGFQVIATDNRPPEELPPALADRFDCILEVDQPHPEALARLSPNLREAAQRSFPLETERRVGLRAWYAVDRLQGQLGLETACRAVFGPQRGAQIFDALSMQDRE